MESQGQPCLKGLPETRTGAAEHLQQHGTSKENLDHGFRNRKYEHTTSVAEPEDSSLPPKKRQKLADNETEVSFIGNNSNSGSGKVSSTTGIEEVSWNDEKEVSRERDNVRNSLKLFPDEQVSNSTSPRGNPKEVHTKDSGKENITRKEIVSYSSVKAIPGEVFEKNVDITRQTHVSYFASGISGEESISHDTEEASEADICMKYDSVVNTESIITIPRAQGIMQDASPRQLSTDIGIEGSVALDVLRGKVFISEGSSEKTSKNSSSDSSGIIPGYLGSISSDIAIGLTSGTTLTVVPTGYKSISVDTAVPKNANNTSVTIPEVLCSSYGSQKLPSGDVSQDHLRNVHCDTSSGTYAVQGGSSIIFDSEGGIPQEIHGNEVQSGINQDSHTQVGVPGASTVGDLTQMTETNGCFVVSSPMEQHLPEFQEQSHGDEGLNLNFQYDDLEGKAMGSFSHEDVHELDAEHDGKHLTMKLDLEHLQILNVGGAVEYMESLPALVTSPKFNANEVPGGPTGSNGESIVLQQGENEKGDGKLTAQEAVILRGDHVHVPKSTDTDAISIQVYPQPQGISLVTTSGILTADITTFPTQVPAILTEGDADESESSSTFAEQFQVVTTSSVLGGDTHQIASPTPRSDTLSIMMSSGDFSRSVVLTEQQQQVLISSMMVPGVAPGQAVHINVPQHSTGTSTLDMPSQTEGSEESHDAKVCSQGGGSEGGRVHMCPHPDCKKVCPRAHKLKLHMLSHTGERPHKCPHEGCEWAFTTAYKLRRHERGHTGERPFLCSKEGCNRRFTTAYNLKTHIRAHSKTNTIICNYEGCGKSFPTNHKLRVHERKHQLGQKPYKCEVEGCGKEFSAMGPLTSHLKSHTGEKPHGCPMEGCEKRFTKASKLKLHLRTHTGERPFSCIAEGCGWSFTSAYKLKRHMRKHTGERPFVCSYEGCHKSFTRSSHLKTHTLVHTGEKPYICPVDGCNKAFTAGSSLNVHIRKHTGNKPYRCEEEGCNKAYTTAANLRAHHKRHEKGKKSSDESMLPSAGSGDNHLHPEYVTVNAVSSVSSAGSLVDNESEVTYTGIHTFPSEDFSPDDVTPLPSVSVHFPSVTLGAIVTSTGNPLASVAGSSPQGVIPDSTLERVKTVSHILPDTRPKTTPVKTVGIPVSSFQPHADHPAQRNVVDGTQIDVAEFVVLHSQEVNNVTTENENLKHAGGFDLSITSMVSHLRCHPHDGSSDGKLVTSEALSAQQPVSEGMVVDHKIVPVSSRALEFRSPVNPEDQFAPPAVIFQEDSIKSGSSDAEGDSVQRSPDITSSSRGLMQINLPHDVIQIHFPQSNTDTHGSPIDVETVPENHHLQAFGSSRLPELQDDGLSGKPELSSYMEEQSSPEQEDGNGDSYPESTINLQDLR